MQHTKIFVTAKSTKQYQGAAHRNICSNKKSLIENKVQRTTIFVVATTIKAKSKGVAHRNICNNEKSLIENKGAAHRNIKNSSVIF